MRLELRFGRYGHHLVPKTFGQTLVPIIRQTLLPNRRVVFLEYFTLVTAVPKVESNLAWSNRRSIALIEA